MIPVGETVGVALQSIRANKMRAFLTMLGVIIGVGAVITMVSLGNGAKKAVEDQIAAMGARVLSVYPGQMFSGGVSSANQVSLTTDDAAALERDCGLLDAVVPEVSSRLTAKYGNKNLNLSVVGTTPNYPMVKNYTFPYGQMFTEGDDQARQRYAVLGADVPTLLEANPAALLHQTIQLRGIPFEVIGILAQGIVLRVFPERGRADPDPTTDRAIPDLREQSATPDLGGSGQEGSHGTGHGGPGAYHAAGAQDSPGRQ